MLKVQEIREIIKLIDDSSINEFTYETNGTKIKMKKATESESNQTIKQAIPLEQSSDIQQVEQVQEIHKEKVTSEKTQVVEQSTVDYDHEIVSPMVGTFYQAPSPESDPYVSINNKIKPDTIVCIVEAMKLFNEIEAEVSGEIVEILVEDGELVEYGQPLFRVKKK